jgi:hypothetical protein
MSVRCDAENEAQSVSDRTLRLQDGILSRISPSVTSCVDSSKKCDDRMRLCKWLLIGQWRRQRLICESWGWRNVMMLHYICLRYGQSRTLCCIVKLVGSRRSRADGRIVQSLAALVDSATAPHARRANDTFVAETFSHRYFLFTIATLCSRNYCMAVMQICC